MEREEISIVVPMYNEEAGIAETIVSLEKVMKASSLRYEIILVDDASSDRTVEIAQAIPDVRILRRHRRFGYGASLLSGIQAATYDTIAIIDADDTYDAKSIPTMVRMLGDDVDMVVGERRGFSSKIPLARRPAKWLIQKFAEFLSGTKIPDINSGLRIFRKEIALNNIRILPKGFSFTTTITLLVLCQGGVVLYEPISYHFRKGKSKFRPINDTANMISLIIRSVLLYAPLRVFIPAALFFLFVAAMILVICIAWLKIILDATITILVVLSVQLFFMGFIADLINRRSR